MFTLLLCRTLFLLGLSLVMNLTKALLEGSSEGELERVVCPENSWLCKSGDQCVPSSRVCDNSYDCYDFSDEHCLNFAKTEENSEYKDVQLFLPHEDAFHQVCFSAFDSYVGHLICQQANQNILLGIKAVFNEKSNTTHKNYISYISCSGAFVSVQKCQISMVESCALLASVNCGNCQFRLEQESGNFTSPGYPYDYFPSLNCKWFITTSKNKILKINFLEFDLPEKKGEICSNGFVKIISRSQTMNKFVDIELCGDSSAFETFYSSTNAITISFYSGRYTPNIRMYKGFKISFHSLDALKKSHSILSEPYKLVAIVSFTAFFVLLLVLICFLTRNASCSCDKKHKRGGCQAQSEMIKRMLVPHSIFVEKEERGSMNNQTNIYNKINANSKHNSCCDEKNASFNSTANNLSRMSQRRVSCKADLLQTQSFGSNCSLQNGEFVTFNDRNFTLSNVEKSENDEGLKELKFDINPMSSSPITTSNANHPNPHEHSLLNDSSVLSNSTTSIKNDNIFFHHSDMDKNLSKKSFLSKSSIPSQTLSMSEIGKSPSRKKVNSIDVPLILLSSDDPTQKPQRLTESC